jgi:hypothetical protein
MFEQYLSHLKSIRTLLEASPLARVGTLVGWRTPSGRNYGVVVGQDGSDLLCISTYTKSLKNDKLVTYYQDESLTQQLPHRSPAPDILSDIQRVPIKKAFKRGTIAGKSVRPFIQTSAEMDLEHEEESNPLHRLGERLQDVLESLNKDENSIDESSLGRVRQKYGAAKATAHRQFLKMVRKDPAAHRRKMRMDKVYHRKHKWHDKLMRKTTRKGFRRISRRHESREDVQNTCPRCELVLSEEIEYCPECGSIVVVEAAKELSDKERRSLAKDATAKSGNSVPTHYVKECSLEAFKKNVEYFYRVKSVEWERQAGGSLSKEAKMKRAQAAAYSALESACGVKSNGKLTPTQIVQKGGGKVEEECEDASSILDESLTPDRRKKLVAAIYKRFPPDSKGCYKKRPNGETFKSTLAKGGKRTVMLTGDAARKLKMANGSSLVLDDASEEHLLTLAKVMGIQ